MSTSMRLLRGVACPALLTIACGVPRPRPVVASPEGELAAVTREARALARPLIERGWTPGAVIALVRGDSVAFVSSGVTTLGGAEVSEDTLFDIGSLTKVFTAILLAQDVSRGVVSLETRLVEVLPGTPGTGSSPWPGATITLGQLATHRSGLPEWPSGFDFARLDDPFVGYDARRLLLELASTPLDHAPGEGPPAYSSLGMGLLGLALEHLSGRDYEALVEERIASPLAMRHTRIDAAAGRPPSRAQGHDDEGRPVAPWSWGHRALAGAGALRSTARDMARLVRAHFGGVAEPLTSALRLAAYPRTALAGGGHVGLGWGIDEDGSISHEGQTNGFHAWLGIDVEARSGVVVLTNSMGGPIAELGRRVLGRLRGVPQEALSLPEAIDVEPGRAGRFAGRYASPDGKAFDVTIDGVGLRLAMVGGRAYRLYAASPSRWFLRVGGVAVTFEDEAAVLEVGAQRLYARRGAGGSTSTVR